MQSVRKGASWKEAPLTPDPHALSISTRGLPVPRVNSPEASRGNKGARTKGLPDFLRVPLPGAVLALSPGLLPQTSLCRGPRRGAAGFRWLSGRFPRPARGLPHPARSSSPSSPQFVLSLSAPFLSGLFCASLFLSFRKPHYGPPPLQRALPPSQTTTGSRLNGGELGFGCSV